jgi:hypothetical protein
VVLHALHFFLHGPCCRYSKAAGQVRQHHQRLCLRPTTYTAVPQHGWRFVEPAKIPNRPTRARKHTATGSKVGR